MGYYALPVNTAMERLRHADITGFRNARQCGLLIYFSQTEASSDAITWDVTSSGEDMLFFTVRLAPSGSGTQATIEVPKAASGSGELYDGNQTYDQPAMMQPLRPAVQELIDSAMEQRPYDWHKIAGPLDTGGGDTAGICTSEKQNLEAGGATYNVRDPGGMTHEQAQQMHNEQMRDEQKSNHTASRPEDNTRPMVNPTGTDPSPYGN